MRPVCSFCPGGQEKPRGRQAWVGSGSAQPRTTSGGVPVSGTVGFSQLRPSRAQGLTSISFPHRASSSVLLLGMSQIFFFFNFLGVWANIASGVVCHEFVLFVCLFFKSHFFMAC